ncbi:MAG: DUF4139 domain-containing protein [Deltaproteobacteria bacterium]|nr:DUF4139 domain-containing protein [Deltaproteobacteria bacterium]
MIVALPRGLAIVLASLLWLAPQVPPAFGAEEGAAPPLRRVVLYKHGMGYLEREGTVSGDSSVALSFRPDQMKDLLTSFFAVDLGGGKITSVRYDTQDPTSKRLEGIPFRVPADSALSEFLATLQGAKVSGRAGGEPYEGRILGLEPRIEVVNGKAVKTGYQLVLLTAAGSLRSLDLYSLGELTFADEPLRRDLARLLEIQLDAKSSGRRNLVVTAAGTGERRIRMGYLLEMPVWKSSYRVLFDRKEADSALLQGWALAENTTDEDWRSVALAFVAGNPLSFSMDLYSPVYVPRPEVPVPGLDGMAVDWRAAPAPEAAGTYAAKTGAKAVGSDSRNALAASPAPPPAAARRPDLAPVGPELGLSAELLAASVGAAAQGAKVGELFSYEAKTPVTVPSGQAAMVPIVSTRIQGRRVLLYRATFSPRPVNAFALRNDGELTLDAGAVTFFEDGTSLGEGILGHTLAPGGQEVIPYAVNASVDVIPQTKSERHPRTRGRLADGVLTLERSESLVTSWRIVNRGKEAATLWLDHPKNPQYRLAKPEKPLKEVGSDYRFEVAVPAGSESLTFVVEERKPVFETVLLANADVTALRLYASEPYLSAGTRKFLTEISELAVRRSALRREEGELEQQSRRLGEEQERLRSNLSTALTNAPKEQELRARWLDSLAAAEQKLAELRRKLDESGEKVRLLEEELAAKIRNFRGE